MNNDTEQFVLIIEKDTKYERRKQISSGVYVTFWVGLCVGFLVCLSILGISQQIFQHYSILFYRDDAISLMRRIWMGVDWKVWIFIACSSVIIGLWQFNKLKRKTLKSLEDKDEY